MSDLAGVTEALRSRGRKALVAFLTAGYPDDDVFDEMVLAAADAGCDVIEVGVPFSDPVADGPVIQAASAAALARGVTLRATLQRIARLSSQVGVPLVCMSYVNPILRMGIDAFAETAQASGVAGCILPDVSFEESAPFRAAARSRGLAYIDMVAPTSGQARMRTIAAAATGFVYLVSVTGVTGARSAPPTGVTELADRVRAVTATPVYVGFGISTAEQAANAARHADGVIIGSRLLTLAEDRARAAARVGAFLAEARHAIDALGRSAISC